MADRLLVARPMRKLMPELKPVMNSIIVAAQSHLVSYRCQFADLEREGGGHRAVQEIARQNGLSHATVKQIKSC